MHYIKWPAIVAISGLLVATAGCRPATSANQPGIAPVDTTITPQNAVADLFLDSASVAAFIQQQQLPLAEGNEVISFYNSRNFQYAWMNGEGPAEVAHLFVNRLHQYNADLPGSAIPWVSGLDSLQARYLTDSATERPDPAVSRQLELLLTWQFFRYAEKAFTADSRVDPKSLGWYIPAKKIDARSFLDSVIGNGGRNFTDYSPMHPLFRQLREKLKMYARIDSSGVWSPTSFSTKSIKPGDSLPEVVAVKRKLHAVGDLAQADTSARYDSAAVRAMRQFEARHGLKADGIIDAAVMQALNTPMATYVQQILLNMERARWIPKPGDGHYVVVNIPSFTLYAYDSGKQQFSMNVVVGKPATNTVIFNGSMTIVALAPYWNVPYSIVKNEMGHTAAYFAKRNMEVVGRYADGLPMVREKPGPRNSLGRVKFLFPNSYNIYLHDTPSKSLFGENKRAFSHGCIRVANPPQLAYWALRNNPEWSREKIDAAMNGTKEIQVKIARPIPVFIGYFTAFVDGDGQLQLRPDIYGHDKKLAEKLFAQPASR